MHAVWLSYMYCTTELCYTPTDHRVYTQHSYMYVEHVHQFVAKTKRGTQSGLSFKVCTKTIIK